MTLIALLSCIDTGFSPIKDPPEVGAPRILLDPEIVNFGSLPEGESAARIITLTSTGDEVLNVTAMTISDGDAWFGLVAPAVGAYPPGESSEITVTYVSLGGPAEGQLSVLSNDPDRPSAVVTLLAEELVPVDTGEEDTGEPVLTQPVAVCSVDPVETQAVHGTADWIGTGSYDPSGTGISEYRWTLASSPAGSAASMPAGAATRRLFSPDVAGEYIGQLIVVNGDGVASEPCWATLIATAGDGLWVEMFWTHGGDDMDLHLLAPGGSLTTSSDCYYANCTWGLEWGSAGTADNPTLDLDDIPGTGPENINVDSPARGSYEVYVHDYPGSVYIGRNDVTVNVYWGGVLQWTDTRNLDSEGSYFPFCEVQAPSGVVTSL
jgi:hypothetical protein